MRALPDREPDVESAGVVCWRPARVGGGPEVLLVRDSFHADWTWPSGTVERREHLPECAVRQAAERAGVQVVLGLPLATAHRTEAGTLTRVSYWAARVTGRSPQAPRETHGDSRWVPVQVAADLLPDAPDAEALTALAGRARADGLATSATLVVRHATARPRDSWARADADRPLVASGRRQAVALGALLQCWRPELVVSSPWRRCLETVEPYLAASGARLRTKGGLSEAGHRRTPDKAARHVRSLLESSHGGVLCTHRPVLGDVLDAVRAWCLPEVAGLVPDGNPYLHPADVLVAHVVHRPGRQPLVIAVERHGTR